MDGRDVGASPSAEPQRTPSSRGGPAAPSEWRRTFCDAQDWIRRAYLRANRTILRRNGNREELEEEAEDMARSVERAELFVLAVPRWRPAQSLVLAELAMLAETYEAAEQLEAYARAPSAGRRAQVNRALAVMRREMNEHARVAARAHARGIPCAVRFSVVRG
jgi:hypothetical protein